MNAPSAAHLRNPSPAAAGTAPELPGAATVPRTTAWTLLLTGLAGLGAAFILLVEKVALLSDPDYVPSCSINPILSCGSIMNTDQASAFGFPNPLLGVVGFSVLLTLGVTLVAGGRLPSWFWWGLQGGTALGVAFVHWLIFTSLYRIGALCPYCMVVWVVTITAFVTTTVHNVRTGLLPVPARARGLATFAPSLVAVWLVAIAALAAVRFWDYWSRSFSGNPPT